MYKLYLEKSSRIHSCGDRKKDNLTLRTLKIVFGALTNEPNRDSKVEETLYRDINLLEKDI
jgi:hypothetical protein